MSKHRDDPFWIQILARVLSALVIVLIYGCIGLVFFSPPAVGRVVAISQFGDDGYITHYECEDVDGPYYCSSKKTGGDRNHYDWSSDFKLVDTFGKGSGSGKKFVGLNKLEGRYYVIEIGTGQGDFDVIEELQLPPAVSGDLFSVAQGSGKKLWFYFENDGRLFEYKEGDEKPHRVQIADGHRFIAAAAFDDGSPTLYCTMPTERIGQCPKKNMYSDAIGFAGYELVHFVFKPFGWIPLLLVVLAAVELFARILYRAYCIG